MRKGAGDARGRQRPLTEAEERSIVYFLRNSQEASLTTAERRFHRSPQVLKEIAAKHGVVIDLARR